ncbi:MAG: fasciclin domain-containing protein [Flavobacteriales bacterium]|nr:fasciclin domain-containing protein [Flavobacteriales bacterium]
MQIGFQNKGVLLLLFLFSIFTAVAQNKYLKTDTSVRTKVLGNDTIYSNKTLTENLSPIANYSKISEALLNSGILEDLDKEEMFTFFVPNNTAFSKYSEEQLDSLFSDKKVLKDILKLHVIPGRVDRNSIERAIELHQGPAHFRTLGGQNLVFRKEGDDLYISSAGIKSKILQTNYFHKNGFFHSISEILLPK